MFSEVDNRKQTIELERLYNQRLEEYRTSQEMVNKLEATIAVNSEKFLELYNNLNPTLIKNYGLELTKDLKDMSEQEVNEFKEKMQTVFNSIYTQLEKYLRTGDVDTVEEIFTAQEVELPNTEGNKTELENEFTLTEQSSNNEEELSTDSLSDDITNLFREEN